MGQQPRQLFVVVGIWVWQVQESKRSSSAALKAVVVAVQLAALQPQAPPGAALSALQLNRLNAAALPQQAVSFPQSRLMQTSALQQVSSAVTAPLSGIRTYEHATHGMHVTL
jgi:hypothetical protein